MNCRPNLYVVMGVSGCGKSLIAQRLASRTGGLYLDADDFHPPENKAKMAAGQALTDEDRWGWLDALNGAVKAKVAAGQAVFLACSALRQIYRDRLSAGLSGARFIYLQGSKELIAARLRARHGHFMPVALLDSQFATLEEPVSALTVSIEPPAPAIVEEILRRLDLPAPPSGSGAN